MILPVYTTTYLLSLHPKLFAPAKPYSGGDSFRLLRHIRPDPKNEQSYFICLKSYRVPHYAMREQANHKIYGRSCWHTERKTYVVGTVSWDAARVAMLTEYLIRKEAEIYIKDILA